MTEDHPDHERAIHVHVAKADKIFDSLAMHKKKLYMQVMFGCSGIHESLKLKSEARHL